MAQTSVPALSTIPTISSPEGAVEIESTIVAQNVNPQPSEIIVPLPQEPSDTPAVDKPSQPSEVETPEPKPEKPSIEDPAVSKKILDTLVLNAIGNSSSRYPWLVNPASNLVESTASFAPAKVENYSDIETQFRGDELVIKNFDYAHFPDEDQFYWVLPENRIAIETRGWQAGINFHGQETKTQINQKIKLTQALWGLQAIWSLPQPLTDLYGEIDLSKFTIQTIAGEIENPTGTEAQPITVNNSNSSASAVRLIPQTPSLGTGSSRSPNGGGALFELLDAENAPLFIQAFPTSNLQPLYEAEGLFVGATIPRSALSEAGIVWKNPLTGEGGASVPPLSSLSGLKIGQIGKFDNLDLLNLLVNPSLRPAERDIYYLNSLYWVGLGQRSPKILQSRTTTEDRFWHQFSINHPHNRTLLQYDSVRAAATYSNVFSNPGLAFSVSLKAGKLNDLQTLNSSLGLLLGGIFELIHPAQLTESLQEARDRYEQRERFANINTKATPDQRRLINQRLNRGLYFANRTSGLAQTSGTLTFPSTITPDRANLFQIRTGNHRRLARFVQLEQLWVDGETYFSKLRLSNESFGRLTFLGMPVPADRTGLSASNRSSAIQMLLQGPDGEEFVQDFNSSDQTVVPFGIRSFDIAFDRIEFSQIGRATTRINRFDGYLFLPTIEGLWSGSSGKWNYTVNSGIWLNLNGDAAFEVSRNNFGTAEPTLGLYVNALINHINSWVQKGADGKPKAVVSAIPSMRFYWSSTSNSANPAYLNLSYSYSRQQKALTYSLTPGLLLVSSKDRIEPVVFLQGQLGLRNGLEFRSSIEVDDDFFYTFETLQRLSPIWSIGAYVQNYRSSDSLTSRVFDLSYGILLKNRSPNQAVSWQSRLGMSGDRFEVRLEGSYQF